MKTFAERNFSLIFDHVLESILIFENSNCVNVNRSCIKLFGAKSKDELIGKNINELIINDYILPQIGSLNIDTFFELEFSRVDGVSFKELVTSKEIEIDGKKFLYIMISKYSTKKIVDDLKHQLDEELSKKAELNSMMIQQNKLASIGEMTGNIAHQWRQPLMEISSIFMSLDAKLLMDMDISRDEIKNVITKVNQITKFMSNTIDDFKNFYAKDKIKEEFCVAKQITFIVSLINTTLKKENIHLDIVIKDNVYLYGYKSEFLQVLLNLFINAKDIFVERSIEKRNIKIEIRKSEENAIISFKDNAGGIKIKPINRVFEPYFSSKGDKGTGMGLFMSKVIIEKNMKGKIEVENSSDGAIFRIILLKAR